ncbi:hypothetical protein [Bailinhaonella thermotolerans]|uniref:Uncharacterized protein n=1 Tax=Bailinhaonella thermotolerans TaxID=1070861 RepID=A0A3A4AZU4_9ACTN|nr:hypothetical protein [Bailinhaonella thermotolerans]RJL31317.1 hypothetical protein D5H75_19910 [Bailinhaonella thermotolerans]
MSRPGAKHAKAEAMRVVRAMVEGAPPTAGSLLATAEPVLGEERAGRCAELVRRGALTRRAERLAAVAALTAGTREIGAGWWARPGPGGTPDEVLRGGDAADPAALETLAARIAEDVAEARWGPPAGQVDLNSWRAADRVPPPPGAEPGDRLVAAFDTGGRVDAVVVRRDDGSPGTELDFDSLRYSGPAEASWAWETALGLGPHRLPGEVPDPYAEAVDPEAAAILRSWALRHGATPAEVGEGWSTVGDVIAAVGAVDWMWRSGEWFGWWRAASALVEQDAKHLAARLEEILS